MKYIKKILKKIKNIPVNIKIYFTTKKNLFNSLNDLGNKYNELMNEVEELRLANKNLLEKSTAEIVISKILKRGINFYEYDSLPYNKKLVYFNEIQSVVGNKSYENELKHFLYDLVEFTAKETKTHEETMNIRTGIVTLETLADRLNSIYDPRKNGRPQEEVVQEYRDI